MSESPEQYDPLQMDILMIMFNETLTAPQTYAVTETEFFEGDPTTMTFSSRDIVVEPSVEAVTFNTVSGWLTFETSGPNVGDRLRGSFSVGVEGTQDLCTDGMGHAAIPINRY